jgi:integrase
MLPARWLRKSRPLLLSVFPSLDGTAIEERNIRHVFTRLLEKSHIRQVRIHDLRHTLASLLI